MKRTLIVGGSLIDGKSNCATENGSILIEDGFIQEVSDGILDCADAQVIDATGCTVLPGLIDTHVHLVWNGSADPAAAIRNESDAYVAVSALETARKFLRLGVTTVCDIGSRTTTVLSITKAIERKIAWGPRIVNSGPVICMTGGHGWEIGIEADGPDAVRKATRQLLKNNPVNFVKLMATGGMYGASEDPGAPQYTVEEMRAAVEEAHNVGKRAAAHAEGLVGIRNALEAGVDRIEHGIYADEECLQTMLARGVFLIPTLVAMRKYAEGEGVLPPKLVEKGKRVVKVHTQTFTRACELGIQIATGTDCGGRNKPPEAYFLEMYAMNEVMSVMDVIKASTSVAAGLLGLPNVGSIEKNFAADIIVVKGNPLEDLHNLRNLQYVIQDGNII